MVQILDMDMTDTANLGNPGYECVIDTKITNELCAKSNVRYL